jgi:FkbM family methyltransferase
MANISRGSHLVKLHTTAGLEYFLSVRDGDLITRTIEASDPPLPYEAVLLGRIDEISRGIPADHWFLDVGAHVGNHSLWWALNSGRKVLAFEPQPATRLLFEHSIISNNLLEKVYLCDCAVGNESCKGASVIVDPDNLGRCVFEKREGAIENYVQMVRIDDFEGIKSRKMKVGLIKIDIEGTEADAIRGAAETIGRDLPIIVAEAHNEEKLAELEAVISNVSFLYTREPRSYCATPTHIWTVRPWECSPSCAASCPPCPCSPRP